MFDLLIKQLIFFKDSSIRIKSYDFIDLELVSLFNKKIKNMNCFENHMINSKIYWGQLRGSSMR